MQRDTQTILSGCCQQEGTAFYFGSVFREMYGSCWASLVAQKVKNLPAMQETRVLSPMAMGTIGLEQPLSLSHIHTRPPPSGSCHTGGDLGHTVQSDRSRQG